MQPYPAEKEDSFGFIHDLCIALRHRWRPTGIYVILTAYLDESGTHDGSPFTVMGGMLASARQWDSYEKAFRKLKALHGFQIFHTKKFKKKAGDFRGWTNAECLALMQDFASLTASAFMEGVTMTLKNEDYDNEYKTGEKPKSFRLDSKYGLCFRQCLYFFILEALKRTHRGRYPTLHVVLESGHENAGDALRIFNETKKEFKPHGLLGEITFADKDECDPLMMADFLAHSAFIMGPRTTLPSWQSLEEVPLKRHETGVSHLSFKPNGLANTKSVLIEQLRLRKHQWENRKR